ncbi:hypothetical protein H112_08838 [Trichophyton rubrum D6]|uniref:Uncharacterized protein n=3 Tax=Trichophyton TaxID=5550 RepID=A0A080WIY1_TRIRC|nr:uncharacterized protein TERG_11709 [Trichophyton rubrum CBS 118892]EZF09811.1 hypothetical protein H100_08859 [Trichophyton rubrum MR850]EZF36673.1 hypothetical protein H102_08820 [Trichophyton rubrum CBS 100081]EZF47265.1 hypothetical protein H103_08842 [Trichophyton rubrum CBS 288.86]EZF58003.1 hypothetical protein H104_08790 [Trichophyton rubrum CBS 289.86]EZF68509.1 hypothetical protein H105_08845 [Trichophyton soudanense CBS 452.61]EZF79221.1 hypothetical protein H110_08843 [Trichophy
MLWPQFQNICGRKCATSQSTIPWPSYSLPAPIISPFEEFPPSRQAMVVLGTERFTDVAGITLSSSSGPLRIRSSISYMHNLLVMDMDPLRIACVYIYMHLAERNLSSTQETLRRSERPVSRNRPACSIYNESS